MASQPITACFRPQGINDEWQDLSNLQGIPTPPEGYRAGPQPLLSSLSVSEGAIASSPFFTKLPLELRRQIYIFAFGGRTVHLFRSPKRPYPLGYRWRISGFVCSRHPLKEACMDHCVLGYEEGSRYPGESGGRERCYLNPAGFLLSCRQGYIEGIEVLYPTNTIHINRVDIMRNIPLVFFPQHLARITSLELLSTFCLFYASRINHRPNGWPALEDLVSILCESNFPNLRKLYWSVTERRPRLGGVREVLKCCERLLEHTDVVARELGSHLHSFELAPHSKLYNKLVEDAQSAGIHEETDMNWPPVRRFWRSVTVDKPEGPGARGLGYWVRPNHRITTPIVGEV